MSASGPGALPPIRIPWAQPSVGEAEADAAAASIAATFLSMGRQVRELERRMAEYAGRRHAVGVSNGTDALEIAMRLLDVGPGDEVLVSSLSYIATVNCIVRQGATPVFCDVDPATLNVDPDSVADSISSRTKAMIAADYCGFAVDYGRLEPVLGAAGVTLVVDGAQSIGTFVGDRPALRFGQIATTSFHAAKIMTTGEGGMVFLDDDVLAERARRYRGQGEIPGRKYIHDTLGFNHRLSDPQAAIGLVQLDKLPTFCAARHEIAARYLALLEDHPAVEVLRALPETTPAWFSFPVLVDQRDAVAAGLRERGIETRSLYPIPTYRQPIAEYPRDVAPHPAAEAAAAQVLNLPVFHGLDADAVDEVAAAVIDLVSAPAPR